MTDSNAAPATHADPVDLLRHAADNIGDPFYVLDRTYSYHVFNQAAERYFDADRRRLLGKCMWDVFPQGRGGDFETACRDAMEAARTSTLTLPSRRHPERTVELTIAPVAGFGISVLLVDVTARKAADAALQASEARLELATRASALGVWEWRAGDSVIIASPRARDIWGFELSDEVTVTGLRARIDPEDLARFDAQTSRALNAALRDEQTYQFRVIAKDGRRRWVRAFGRAVFDGEDDEARIVRYVGTNEDITADKEAEERLRLLAREVDHRANNLLAVVQGLISLTRAENVETLKASLLGRISALARAHQLLAEGRWVGADLDTLIREEVRPFELGDVSRFRLEGPPYLLSPAAAQGIGMVIHELATTAVKHGALSNGEGQVEIQWGFQPGDTARLVLTWTESGGPKVLPPTRSGLGSTVLKRALGGNLKGAVHLDWRPDGLVCRLEIPTTAPDEVA